MNDMDDRGSRELSTQTFVIVAVTGVVAAAVLFVLAASLDLPALAVLGLLPLLAVGIAKWWWT